MRIQSPLSAEMVDRLLESLPLDITIIDDHDKVIGWTTGNRKLFNIGEEVMGTDVRECHPMKSMDSLENLLAEMKAGKLDSTRSVKDVEKGGRKRRFAVHYIALRDDMGNYKGCMEVDMDLSDLAESDGEVESY